MTTWVLVYWLVTTSSAGRGITTATISFDSQITCTAALAAMRQNSSTFTLDGKCVKQHD